MARSKLTVYRVVVQLELPIAVALPAGMSFDLGFHCSLVCVVLPLLIDVCRNRDGTGRPGPAGRERDMTWGSRRFESGEVR